MVEGNVQNSSGKSGQLRQSIAGTRQEIIAPVVWIGSQQINVAQLVLDTVALVQQLAEQLASHTPPDTGQPTNSSAIAQSGQQEILTRHRPVSPHNPLPQRVFYYPSPDRIRRTQRHAPARPSPRRTIRRSCAERAVGCATAPEK